MKHRTLMAFFMLMAWSVTCSVSAADNPARPRSSAPVDEATFKTLDMDGDGYISRLEVRRETSLERRFDQFDTNRDGRLSREELRGTYRVETPGDQVNRAIGK